LEWESGEVEIWIGEWGLPGRWVCLEIGIGISDGREGLLFFLFFPVVLLKFVLICKGS
jgi:hypothetical protein